MSLEKRITVRIARMKTNVFIRDDFKDLGGYDQVGRAIRLEVTVGAGVERPDYAAG